MNTFLKCFIVLTSVFVLNQIPHTLFAQKTTNNLTDSLYESYLKTNVDSEKVKILLQLAIRTNCKDSVKKLGFINNASKIAEKLKWDKGRLTCNIILGDYFSSCRKENQEAISRYQNAAYLSETLQDTVNQVIALEKIAANYEILGQHNESLDFYGKILTLDAGPGVSMGVLSNMGVIYSNIGDYRQALIFHNKSLQLLDEVMYAKKGGDKQDSATRAGLLLNIGDIYVAMLQIDKALENYNSAYKLGKLTHEEYLQFFSVMSIGKAYYVRKDYPKAIKNLELALFDARNLNQPMYEAPILDQLANAYLATGTIDKARQYAQSSLDIVQRNNFISQFPKTYTTFSKLLSLQNDNAGAVVYLQKALDYSQKTKAIEDEKNAWEALSSLYEKMNQPAKALLAYRHFITLRDSLYNIDKANELVRIDLQAGFGRKQLADSLQHVKQSRAYELKMQRQQGITYSVLIGLVLVMLLSFFIYRNYNTQKKYNELLSKEKANHLAYIEAQSDALTDFAHIQSHDIRGPVSTLLGLVKVFNFDDPNDPDNKEVIEGIAIVTERLDKIVTDVVSKENQFSTKSQFNKVAKK